MSTKEERRRRVGTENSNERRNEGKEEQMEKRVHMQLTETREMLFI